MSCDRVFQAHFENQADIIYEFKCARKPPTITLLRFKFITASLLNSFREELKKKMHASFQQVFARIGSEYFALDDDNYDKRFGPEMLLMLKGLFYTHTA